MASKHAATLFRYMPPIRERWLPCLNGKLWYSQPRSFNDPWDSQFPLLFDTALVPTGGKQKCLQQYAEKFKEALAELFEPPDAPFSEDPGSLIASLTPWAKSVSHRLGSVATACFCRTLHSHLLWSYYASSHQGVCIEYDYCYQPDNNLHAQELILPVRYSSHFPAIQLSEILAAKYPMKYVGELLFTKNLAWAHENEWRAVLLSKRGNALYELPRGMRLTRVYAGCAMPAELVEQLKEDCAARNLPVDQLRRASHSYALLEPGESDDVAVIDPSRGVA
jgi:hypothetical protein